MGKLKYFCKMLCLAILVFNKAKAKSSRLCIISQTMLEFISRVINSQEFSYKSNKVIRCGSVVNALVGLFKVKNSFIIVMLVLPTKDAI